MIVGMVAGYQEAKAQGKFVAIYGGSFAMIGGTTFQNSQGTKAAAVIELERKGYGLVVDGHITEIFEPSKYHPKVNHEGQSIDQSLADAYAAMSRIAYAYNDPRRIEDLRLSNNGTAVVYRFSGVTSVIPNPDAGA